MTDFNSPVKPEELIQPPKKEFPYRKILEDTLATQKNMLFYLQERIRMIDKDWPKDKYMTDADEGYQLYIEAQISKIKTQGEIDILQRVITEKQNYFDNYCKQFEKDIEDLKLHYARVVSMAKKSTKPEVKKILATVIWERVEEDDEKRVALYKQLKKYI